MLSKKIMIASMVLLSSCGKQSDIAGLNDQELEVKAMQLPLAERYQLYQQVYDRDRPPNVGLAGKIAELGDPAFGLALQKAERGDANEVGSALEVIGIYVENSGKECTQIQIDSVKKNIREKFQNEKSAKIAMQRLAISCTKSG